MMAGDGDPAAVGRLEDVLGDELLAVVDAELALQGQSDGDEAARQVGGDAIAISAGSQATWRRSQYAVSSRRAGSGRSAGASRVNRSATTSWTVPRFSRSSRTRLQSP